MVGLDWQNIGMFLSDMRLYFSSQVECKQSTSKRENGECQMDDLLNGLTNYGKEEFRGILKEGRTVTIFWYDRLTEMEYI